MKIGISACLTGVSCTYRGDDNLSDIYSLLKDKYEFITVCPEVLGGLPIPRYPAEIISFSPLIIKNINGEDVTQEYVTGASKALDIFLDNHVQIAILKFRSPSCGCDGVYDGTFSHRLIDGQGVFVQLLKDKGIKVFHENQIDEILDFLK